MKKLIICLVLFLVFPPFAFGQDKQAITDEGRPVVLKDDGTWEYAEEQGETPPDPESIIYPARPFIRLLDLAVSHEGKVYALVDDGLEIMDVNTRRSAPRLFDPKGTVWVLPPFYQSRKEAIAVDGDGNPVILWNGYREANSRESYVTMVQAEESVKLDWSVRSRDFVLGPDGHFFILGHPSDGSHFVQERTESGDVRLLVLTQANLVHEFSPSGEWVRSFHTWPNLELRDPPMILSSSLAAAKGSIFVANPYLSESVFEYRNGVLIRTYDFDQPLGLSRMIGSIFASGNKVYVSSRTGKKRIRPETPGILTGDGPGRIDFDPLQTELHVIEKGRLQLVSTGGPKGKRIGMTPDGQLIARVRISMPDRPNQWGLFLIDLPSDR